MWQCVICETEIEDDEWEVCWKCSAPRHPSEEELPQLRAAHELRLKRFVGCIRCEARMIYDGTQRLVHRDNSLIDLLIHEATILNQRLDVYHCPTCGKVEFFVDGIGDERRGEEDQ